MTLYRGEMEGVLLVKSQRIMGEPSYCCFFVNFRASAIRRSQLNRVLLHGQIQDISLEEMR